jgi:serine/threonine protein kinase
MHRDLKPENLLVSADDTLKVCDFGGSVEHILGDTSSERKTFCGTYEYMSPEMI